MTLAVPVENHRRKPDRRQALESPYRRDYEQSVASALDREPANLAAAIAWFRGVCAEELPVTLHRAGVWRDYGLHAEGGSALGSPALSDPFRRFLQDSPSATDQDGNYIKPLRAALSRMSRHHPLTARHLFRLALVDGDWKRHAANEGFQDEEMALYLWGALLMLWKDFTRKVQMLQ